MIPWTSLFPIPGPEGGTTERIIIPMATSASGSATLMTGALAAAVSLAVALLTLRGNRTREAENWLRDHAFDIAKNLSDNYLVIDLECRRNDLIDDLLLSAPGWSYKKRLGELSWKVLNEAVKRYDSAISEGLLLMPTPAIAERLKLLRTHLQEAVEATKRLPEGTPMNAQMRTQDFDARNQEALERLQPIHQSALDLITKGYLLPRNGKPKGWRRKHT